MVEPSLVRIVFVSCWWGWSLAVHQIERITAEGICSVEDGAGPLAGFASFDTVDVVLPGLVSVERPWLRYMKH